ncbi:hypothetical protein [Methylocapsa palsarum]|uniref:Uncharacterized protein n=1 Tax=Methylocapsa palsarum TaxID=1612308 RepID=A0A1I4CKS9_9HYPH|nr:hypothetical protein [Methylocapsa palsarum]SFK81892.1 hypothetical protein SAMN05444581_12426 [Methylocapsa palsarum]
MPLSFLLKSGGYNFVSGTVGAELSAAALNLDARLRVLRLF